MVVTQLMKILLPAVCVSCSTLHQLTEPVAPSTPATATATGEAAPAGLVASMKDIAISAGNTNSTAAVTVATTTSGSNDENRDQRAEDEAMLAVQSKADGTEGSRCLC